MKRLPARITGFGRPNLRPRLRSIPAGCAAGVDMRIGLEIASLPLRVETTVTSVSPTQSSASA